MKLKIVTKLVFIGWSAVIAAQNIRLDEPAISNRIFFEEADELVAVEGEYFYKQTNTEVRAWYRTSKEDSAYVGRDDDSLHTAGASNGAYIEILPDERATHSDPLEREVNFTEKAGSMAVVHYRIKFNNPGRYYVWVRAFSSGSEDNGVHVGLNGEWPQSGRRMQWCEGKHQWTWASKQRTKEEHCGVPHQIYLDVDSVGVHDIQFSMREDGFEMDKFLLTTDINYVPDDIGAEFNPVNEQ